MTKLEFFKLADKTSLDGGFPAIAFRQNIVFPEQKVFDGCRYRNAEGKGCLVGITIPNEKYTPKMECGVASDLYDEFPFLKDYIPEGMTIRDMNECQVVHDNLAIDCERDKSPWPHEEFMKRLSALKCFRKS